MPSLLQLPQNIWRDNVVYFLPKVEDLARLDSAVANACDRATFHSNISGCTRFNVYNGRNKRGKLNWICMHNIVINRIEICKEPRTEERTFIDKLLPQVLWIHLANAALSRNCDFLQWTRFGTLTNLCVSNCEIVDVNGLAACLNLVELQIYDCAEVTEESFAKGISGCVKLKFCCLYNCANLRAPAVTALLTSCVLLQSVELTGYFDLHQALTPLNSVLKLDSFTCSEPSSTVCLKGSAMHTMATVLPQLTYLELNYQYNYVTDADIEVFARGCKCLTFMKLLHRMPYVTNIGVMSIARGLAQLSTLYLSHLSITNAAVQAVGTHCRKLHTLDVSHCRMLTDAAFSTLNMAYLKSLNITGTRVTENTLYCASERVVFPSLDRNVLSSKSVVHAIMPSLLQLPQNIWRDNVVFFLRRFEDLVRMDRAVFNKSDRATFHKNISGCRRFEWKNFDGREGQVMWFALRNIIFKDVEFSGNPTAEDMAYIPQLISHAVIVHFSEAALSQSDLSQWGLTETVLDLWFDNSSVEDVSALSACRNLTELDVHKCPNVMDESFVSGVAGCISLRQCCLQHCDGLSGAAIAALLESCVHLESLDLSGCFDLQQTFTRFNAVSNLQTLTSLDDGGETNLAGASIHGIARSLPNLHTLKLDCATNTVLDGDIEVLVRGCKSLTSLSLLHFEDLSNTGLLSIAHHLPQLKYFELDQCMAGDSGVIALASAATALHSLYLKGLHIKDAAVQGTADSVECCRIWGVHDCAMLTDNAFLTLNVACLETLDVTGTRVTGTFAAHIFGAGSGVRSFTCSQGVHLNSAFVQSTPRCTRLTFLSLGTNRLTETDWYLYISHVKSVTDAVALSFRKRCPALCVSILRDCSVSPEVMALLTTIH